MIAHVDYYKVGTIDEIVRSGRKTVSILGWNIVVIFHNREFYAIERGSLAGDGPNTFLPDDTTFSRNGSKTVLDKFLLGPAGSSWGKLKYFPIKIEDEFVLVGVTN